MGAMRLRAALVVAATAAGALAVPTSAAAKPMPGCAPTAGVTGGEWRTFGHDLANTRTQPSEKVISPADVPTLRTAWVFSAVNAGGAGDFTGTPVVADGCVYMASTRGWAFAVNADTGKLVWKRKMPHGGNVNSTVGVSTRTVEPPSSRDVRIRVPRRVRGSRVVSARIYAGARKTKALKGRRLRSPVLVRGVSSKRFTARIVVRTAKGRKATLKRRFRALTAQKVGTVYMFVTRTQKADGCPPGDPCIGPYALALDQATGNIVWATPSVDDQAGADTYGSPVFHDGVVMMGVSGGSAELGDEADRHAFQGSMSFIDASSGRVIKKTWTIHPPEQPEDDFAGAGIWSTPAIDSEDKVAYVGTANPFKPQAEHKNANSVVKFDIDLKSPRFGEIVGSYKGQIDEYVPAFSELPCYDFPNNYPPYYPQGVGSCGDIDLDFGASPNLFRGAGGRKLVGAGQKSGVYHVFDAKTMEPVWTQIVGPPGAFGGVVGSTAHDGNSVYGPITVPGYVWSIAAGDGRHRWVGPVADGMHWGPPVAVANGVVYTVDFSGFLDAFDARTGALLAKRPLAMGGGGAVSPTWAGVSIARNTVFAAVGVLGLADGFVVAYRPGGPQNVAGDLANTGTGGGGGGGGGGGAAPGGPSILAGPGASSTGYATRLMTTRVGGPLSFVNLDIVQHDVVSVEQGAGGPLFRTPLIGLGETAPVEGLDKVQSGKSYEFFCSLHPGMRGTLAVQ